MPRKRRDVPWLDTREGVYHAFWYDPSKGPLGANGKPRGRTERLSLRTADAVEAAARFGAFLTQGKDIYAGGSGKPVRLTCGAAFDYYIEEHVKPNVVDKQRQEDAIANLRLFFNDVACADVDIPMSEAYALKRMDGTLCKPTKHGKARKASAGTVKRELNTLLASITHCIKRKKVGISKVDAPTIKKPKTKRSKGLWLFHDELLALRTAADQKTRDFIDVAYQTAGRKMSVASLTVFQVNLEGRRIDLMKAGDDETNKRKPIVHISPELAPVVKRLVESSTDGTLFGRGYDPQSGFKAARRKAGLSTLAAKDMRPSGKLGIHVLRHTRATHLLQKGAKPKAVADLLGDNVVTVLKVYGHACPDYLENELGEGIME